MERRFIVLISVLGAMLLAEGYLAATRPISVSEAYLYDQFVRPTVRQVLASELPDRDVLYALLEKRSVGLWHVSPFTVRLPSILFSALYMWSLWRIRWWLVFAVPIPLFARADGIGMALALLACALAYRRTAGMCLGLAAAARLEFAIPAAVIGIVLYRQWDDWTNRILIPACVTALVVLVLPLSHAHAARQSLPELTGSQTEELQAALDALPRNEAIRIATDPQIEPVLHFYRAQHRIAQWQDTAPPDYLVLPLDQAEQRHLIVTYRNSSFAVARNAP